MTKYVSIYKFHKERYLTLIKQYRGNDYTDEDLNRMTYEELKDAFNKANSEYKEEMKNYIKNIKQSGDTNYTEEKLAKMSVNQLKYAYNNSIIQSNKAPDNQANLVFLIN